MAAEPRFGQGIDYYQIMNNAIATAPKLTSVEARQFLRDLYDRATGIYGQEEAKDRPLVGVAMHPSEDYIKFSSYRDVLMEYALNDYQAIWGLNVQEFLGLPHWKVKMLRELTPEVRAERKKNVELALQMQEEKFKGE